MPADVGRIRREHVESFIEDQLKRWTPNTAANRYRSLQQFFKFLVDEGEIKNSPMEKMKPPKQPEVLTPVLEADELEKLLRVCQGQTFEDRRDYALIRVFITTGVRRAEGEGLRVSDDPTQNDIDLDAGQARVFGKGSRERLVPLDPRTVKALDRYLRVRSRHPYARTSWLWLGKRGRLTDEGIRQLIQRRAREAGLGKIHVHQLRHSFAHHWLSDGGQESDLMRIAGWRSAQMLRRYASSAAQERALRPPAKSASAIGSRNLGFHAGSSPMGSSYNCKSIGAETGQA